MTEEIKKISQILIKYPDENGSPQEETAEIAVKLENVIGLQDALDNITAGEVTKDSVVNALGWITLELIDNGTSGWQLNHADSGNNLTADSNGLYYADAQLATQQWVESQGYKELPTVSVDNSSEVLTVNEAGLWESKALPTYDGDVENGTVENKGLPAVTTADNGKILTVVDGVWAAANLPNAEDTTF